VEILLQSGNVYIPGVKQRITVRVEDPDQQRWGFEMTARLNSDQEKSSAGDFTPIDHMTQVICDDAAPKPCSGGASFITHTSAGTRLGMTGGATFKFDWTPPAQNVGNITLYAAGNAANGDGNSTGDNIYTSRVQLSPLIPGVPLVTGTNVVSSANFEPGNLGPNSWVTIYGVNLAATTRNWSEDDFLNGGLPFSLDGVSVLLTTLGVPRLAYVGYVSPTQVNFLLPVDVQPTPTTVQIKNPAGISASVPITIRATAPQLFTTDGKSVMGLHATGFSLGKSSPAAPGETIRIYATGLGQTSPALINGQQVTDAIPLARLPQVIIDDGPANVLAASVVPGAPGMYLITLQVPPDAKNGDLPMIVLVGTTASPTVTLTVQK
jgi:uncharacterized protein (TIGR03437 family)